MTFYFHEEAEIEFDKAVQYYEECRPGLGMDFASEVYEAIGRITQFPTAIPQEMQHVQRCVHFFFSFGAGAGD